MTEKATYKESSIERILFYPVKAKVYKLWDILLKWTTFTYATDILLFLFDKLLFGDWKYVYHIGRVKDIYVHKSLKLLQMSGTFY